MASPRQPSNRTMRRLPLFLDRPLRRFLKHLPTVRRSMRPRYLLLIPLLLLLHYTSPRTISLAKPARTTLTNETTTITPCTQHSCTSHLTPAQTLNLLAALSNTKFLFVHTICNTTAHKLPPSTDRFYSTATTILLPREHFLKTGFDERYQDPLLPSLISRLTRLTPALRHIQLSALPAHAIVQIHLPLPAWQPSQASVYAITSRSPLSLTLHKSPALHEFSEHSLQTARQRALHDVHNLPWQLLHRLPADALHGLITALDSGKTLLLIHVAHGLGNRLRALGSSLAFAAASNRIPILAWPPDAHCAVNFHQLFEEHLPVITQFPGYPFNEARFYDRAWMKWDAYNYMPGEGGLKDALIQNSDNHIYYKGAYVMRTPLTSWDTANEHLRALIPVKTIRERVQRVEKRLQRSIGVHVRHLSTDKDIGGVDPVGEYGDFDTRVIGYFRSACSPAVFIDELRKVKSQTGLKEMFIAADSPQWRDEIADEIDGVWGMEGCEGRCEIDAMVDLLALARCPTVLGSFWSSFSEAIQRFSGRKIRLAGVDFGHGGAQFGKDVEEFARDIVQKRRAAGK